MSSGPGVLSEEDDHGVEGGHQKDCQAAQKVEPDVGVSQP